MNVLTVSPGAGSMMWENQPAALTELFGSTVHRCRVDLGALFSNVKHLKVSGVSDVADTSLVRPSDWNAAHVVKAAEIRLSVNVIVPAVAGSRMRAQYSLDGLAWSYFDVASAGPNASIDVAGVNISAWAPIAAEAIADVWARIVGIQGNGVDDPEFGLIQLQVR